MAGVTREDLKTILLFGIHIARIDEEFAPLEKNILARFADAMKLSGTERTDLLEQTVSLGEGLIRLSGPEARTLLLKTLCAVSHCDGKKHPAEIAFVNKVAEKTGGQAVVLPPTEWGRYEEEVFEALKNVG